MLATPETDSEAFLEELRLHGHDGLTRGRVSTVQVNLGLRCNLACHHCHVESGPKRTEALDRVGVERVLELLESNPDVETLDLTGGAPELHPDFRDLVCGARRLGRRVIDRCNLTVLFEPGQEDTADFLAEQEVEIVASLPCYSLENVEKQRGRGVFDGSIRALQQLNSLGYGHGSGARDDLPNNPPNDARDRRLILDLVYNPVGPFLPPSQETLEAEYREALDREFGIVFDRLLTITNMPIKRFAHELLRDGQYADYMQVLIEHFNADNLPGLMCRHTVSVSHDGKLYDCDFNQALGLETPGGACTIFEIDDLALLENQDIATGSHCFGCTSGAGSSCGGALS